MKTACEVEVQELESRIHFDGAQITPYLQASVASPSVSHTVASLSQARSGIGATSVGTKAIFAGGEIGPYGIPVGTIDLYDAATGQWSATTLPTVRGTVSAVTAGSKAVFAAGNSVDVYDDSTSQWSSAPITLGRSGMAIGANSSPATVVIAGGVFSQRAGGPLLESDVVNIFNASTGRWSISHLSQPRSQAATASVGSLILIAGGSANDQRPETARSQSRAVDIYNAATGTWTKGKLSQPRVNIAATTLGHQVFFAGGSTYSAKRRHLIHSNRVDIYNALTGKWKTARLSVARDDIGAVTVGTKAIFAGGAGSDDGVVDIYDSVTGRWSVERLPVPQNSSGVAVIGTKAIFASGGAGLVNIYDASVDAWSTAPVASNDLAITALGPTAFIAGGNAKVDLYTDTAPSAVLNGFVTGAVGRKNAVTISNA
jgi:hypothetical protein